MFKKHWARIGLGLCAVGVAYVVVVTVQPSSPTPPLPVISSNVVPDGSVESGLMGDTKIAELLRAKKVFGADGQGVTLVEMQPPLSSPVNITLAYYDSNQPALGMSAAPLSVTVTSYTGRDRHTLHPSVSSCSFFGVLYVGDIDLLPSEIPRQKSDGTFPPATGRVLSTFSDKGDLSSACATSQPN